VNVPGFGTTGGGVTGTGTFCGRCSFTAAAPLSGHGHGPEFSVRSRSRARLFVLMGKSVTRSGGDAS